MLKLNDIGNIQKINEDSLNKLGWNVQSGLDYILLKKPEKETSMTATVLIKKNKTSHSNYKVSWVLYRQTKKGKKAYIHYVNDFLGKDKTGIEVKRAIFGILNPYF